MNTTTQHIKALLVDDGREFAMIRKTDLAALMQIAETDPHQGRFLDPIGAHKAEIKRLELEVEGYRRLRFKSDLIAFRHGGERRRYMANNKALQARVYQVNSWLDESARRFLEGMTQSFHDGIALRRLARFRRKFPAIGALMDVTP